MPTNPAPGGSNRTRPMPLFPLGTVLVPGMPLALHVFEPRYRQLMTDLLAGSASDPAFGVVALRRGWEVGRIGDVYEVGTVARITDVVAHSDGRFDVTAVGQERFAIESIDTTARPYLSATVRVLPEVEGPADPSALLNALELWRSYGRLVTGLTRIPGITRTGLPALDDASYSIDRHEGAAGADAVPGSAAAVSASQLGYAVAQLPSLTVGDRQALLACTDAASRLAAAVRVLRRERILLNRLAAIPASAGMLGAQPSAS